MYVWRQRDAEVVAENIQAGGISGGVVVYHGGMDSTSRIKAQSKFMRGKARICVATIAFGLGINKADVAGVIHLYLSSSPEHYIQEIGRAGRNGSSAKAIALVLADEVFIRNSLAHSDLVSSSQARTLVSFLLRLINDALESLPFERSKVHPVHVALPLTEAMIGSDCKVETVETILSLLEQRSEKESLLVIEGISYDKVTIAPKRQSLEHLSEKEPIAAAILCCATCIEAPSMTSTEAPSVLSWADKERQPKLVSHAYGSYTFSVANCSNCLGESAEPRHVFAALRRLEAMGEFDFLLGTSPSDRVLSIRLTNAGMNLFGGSNITTLNDIVRETEEQFVSTISASANKVIDINHIMRLVSICNEHVTEGSNCNKSASLLLFQSLIAKYFDAEGQGKMLTNEAEFPSFNTHFTDREISADVQTTFFLLHDLQESIHGTKFLRLGALDAIDYTALLITKFLHGLAPASIQLSLVRHHPCFGKMQSVRFGKLHEVVSQILQ